MAKKQDKAYVKFVDELKTHIEQSRYQAAKLVNKEILLLYFKVGKLLSEKAASEGWGAKALEIISNEIQQSFKGIKGFSVRNLFNMQLFYNEYKSVIMQTLSAQLGSSKKSVKSSLTKGKPIMQTVSAVIKNDAFLEYLFKVGFSHHLLILTKCPTLEERVFYIAKAAENHWSYRVLEYHLQSNLYKKQGKLIHNFKKTLPTKIQQHAIDAFKDEYLLNFINISEDENEKVLENAIVQNIKLFLMSLGSEFSFMGSQYRLQVGKKEFFIDLLFYNRKLQAMIALELKTTEFKPEHAGKMEFYLVALDKQVRMPHENPSIGIILCKEKDKTVVEYSLHTKQNPIGVSTFDYKDLPKKYKDALPNPKEFIKLLN